MSAKDRIKIFSRHNQTAFSRKSFKDLTTGWIINKDDFLAQKFNATTRYFTSVSHPFSPKHCVTRPEGLYLTIRFQGTYYQKIVSIHEKIIDFMVKNNLKAVSDIYVYPLRNHWLTENTKEYINQISFQVQPYLDEEQNTPLPQKNRCDSEVFFLCCAKTLEHLFRHGNGFLGFTSICGHMF